MRTLLALALLTACAAEKEGPDPSAQCDRFVNLYCDRWTACVDNAAPHSECRESTGIDCGATVAVSDDYPECLDALRAQACSAVEAGELPARCEGVLLE